MVDLRGKFLIASPKLVDPNFYRAVLLMVQHNDAGAMGLVLNRPTETRVKDVWEQVSDGECRTDAVLYHGGPCEGPLMLLHTHEPASQIEIGGGLYFSAERDHVQWLLEGDGGPTKAFVGYAGWTAGQIEAEIAEGSWLHLPANAEAVLEGEPAWEELIKRIAPAMIEVRVVPKDPSLN